MMIDLYLRTETADDFAAACPFLRDEDGNWITGAEAFAFDPIGPVVLEHGTYDEDGAEIEAPEIDGRFHAIMRCRPEIAASVPDALKLDYADAPRKWAGEAASLVVPVPQIISDRQFAEILAIDGLITEDEALAWAGPGVVPAQLLDAVEMIPDDAIRFSAKMHLVGATQFLRDNAFVLMLGMILGRDAAQLDDIWTRAAAL